MCFGVSVCSILFPSRSRQKWHPVFRLDTYVLPMAEHCPMAPRRPERARRVGDEGKVKLDAGVSRCASTLFPSGTSRRRDCPEDPQVAPPLPDTVRLTCVHAAMTRPQARRSLLTGSAVFAHNRYPCSCRRSCTYRGSLEGGSWKTRVEGVDPERTDKRISTVLAAQAEKRGVLLLNHLIYARRPTIFHGARAM